MKRFNSVIFALAIGAGGAFAQVKPVAPRIINAGILNPRAVIFPQPEYPESAKQAHIGALVAVDVVVDESGMVISAKAEMYDQHDLRNPDGTKAGPAVVDTALREAAENVAWHATFAPFVLKGQPAKLSGKLIYNFIADDSNLPPRIGEIYGPLLNSQALELPQPSYPPAAKPPNSDQTVTVQVTVDESGNVVSATAVTGLGILRVPAEQAAMKAKFKPSSLAGEPTTIHGILRYTFSAASK